MCVCVCVGGEIRGARDFVRSRLHLKSRSDILVAISDGAHLRRGTDSPTLKKQNRNKNTPVKR